MTTTCIISRLVRRTRTLAFATIVFVGAQNASVSTAAAGSCEPNRPQTSGFACSSYEGARTAKLPLTGDTRVASEGTPQAPGLG
jgi:hypothetical protein